MADKNNINVDEVVENLKNLNNTADNTGAYDTQDINDNKLMALLSYISILVFIPIFLAGKSKFARFHANQGLVLFLCSLIWGVAFSIVSKILGGIILIGLIIKIIGWLVEAVFLVLAVLGIVNVVKGRAKELPVIGKTKILK